MTWALRLIEPDWSADNLFRIGGHGNICKVMTTKCEEHSNIRNVYTNKQSYTLQWFLMSEVLYLESYKRSNMRNRSSQSLKLNDSK